jgi:NAD(P)H-flavin reductase
LRKHKVINIRELTNSTFVLRFEKQNLLFQSGQFVMLGTNGALNQREYTVYSGEKEDFLEVLIREIEGGKVSRNLKKLKPGDLIDVDGPFGFFRFNPDLFASKKFLFVATGTGISPFHSFVKTYPEIDYKLIHGVRFHHEAYDHQDFDSTKIMLCTTGDSLGDIEGRVTRYLSEIELDTSTNCFLCGNSEMIYETFDILSSKGIPLSNIYSEVYF